MPNPGGGPRGRDECSRCKILELRELLAEEANRARELVSAARRMTGAILEQDMSGIREAAAAEAELVREIEALEERRISWVARWAEERGAAPKESRGLTLSDVLARLSPEEAAEIRQTADELVKALDELRTVHRQNADLLSYSLAHVQVLLVASTGEAESHGVYGRDRRKPEVQPRALVDWRV